MVSDCPPPFTPDSGAVQNDVMLLCNDEKQLTVSRRLLACETGYFRSLFSGNFSDSWKDSHKLPYSGELVSDVVTGLQIVISEEVPIWSLTKSCALINPVTFLQVDRLVPLLRNSITSQVDIENLLNIYRYSIQRDFLLSEMLWELVLKNFGKLADAGEYLRMDEDELTAAMTSETVNIESRMENVVLSRYMKKNPDSPNVHRLSQQLRRSGDGVRHPVVMNRVPKDILLAVGGWTSHGPTDIVEAFNPRNERWIRVSQMPQERKAYHGLSQLDNRLYICGGMNGREYFRSAKCYNLNTKMWESVPDFAVRRCYTKSVSIPSTDGSSQLMILGGFNGTRRLSSCELAGPVTGGWRFVKSMSKPRSDGAAVVMKDGVVAIGGFDGRVVHNDGEIYDVKTNSWSSLGRRMLLPRTGNAAVDLNETTTFMVAGGFNGTARLASAEFYDIREGRFHNLPNMLTNRSNFALERINGEIYAVGGFDGTTTTALCEKFDLVAQQWISLPELSVSRSALKLVRLSDHEIIRELVDFDGGEDE